MTHLILTALFNLAKFISQRVHAIKIVHVSPCTRTCTCTFVYFILLLLLVTPHTRCRLRMLKLERIKDFLLMEQEFIQNQERLKPQEEKNQVRDRIYIHYKNGELSLSYFWRNLIKVPVL